jgi:hypothetical protein
MGIARRKAGSLVDCPKCHREIRVPETDQPEPPAKSDLLEHSSFERWLEPPAGKAGLGRRTVEKSVEPPSSDVPWTSAEPPPARISPSKILGDIPWLQGWTAAALIATAFLLGLLAGRYLFPSRTKPASASTHRPTTAVAEVVPAVAEEPAADPKAIIVRGRVLYQKDGKKLPDDGGSVLVIPSDQKPAEKLPALGLRPEDHALRHQPGVEQLRRLGGLFDHLDVEGRFSVTLPRQAEYYVLILSKNVDRSARQAIFPDELSILQKYFADVPELIGNREFLLVAPKTAPGRPASIEHVY